MRRIIMISLIAVASSPLAAQSKKILDIFKQLPGAAVFDLTQATRDSMLQGKTYYPATNDSDAVEAYNYGYATSVADYIYISLSYETGQRATALVEIRSFPMKNLQQLVVVSRTGGVLQVAYHQQELSAFLRTDKNLTPYKKSIFSATDEAIFFKRGIPDSIRKAILANSNTCFDFSQEKVQLKLNLNLLANGETYKNWLKGDCVAFTWTGSRFQIDRIWFEN